MNWTDIVLGLVAGVSVPMQAAINSQLRQIVASPVLAALISFAVGTIALFACAAGLRAPIPEGRLVLHAPWWVWLGGVLGVFYVITAILVTPRVGAASLMALAVIGQLTASLVLDHYGWLGLPLQPLSALRVVGAVLLVAGVILITRF